MTRTGYEYLATRLVDELNRRRVEASYAPITFVDDAANPVAPAPVILPPLEVRCRASSARRLLEVAILEVDEVVAAVTITADVLRRRNGHHLRTEVETLLRRDLERHDLARGRR